MPVTEKDVRTALRTVQDPELHLDLVVLGLVYDIEVDGGDVHVVMSLTSPMCPVAEQIVVDARNAVSRGWIVARSTSRSIRCGPPTGSLR